MTEGEVIMHLKFGRDEINLMQRSQIDNFMKENYPNEYDQIGSIFGDLTTQPKILQFLEAH